MVTRRRYRKGKPFDLSVSHAAGLGWVIEIRANRCGPFRAVLPECACGRPYGCTHRPGHAGSNVHHRTTFCHQFGAATGRRYHAEQVGLYVAAVMHSYGFRGRRVHVA